MENAIIVAKLVRMILRMDVHHVILVKDKLLLQVFNHFNVLVRILNNLLILMEYALIVIILGK